MGEATHWRVADYVRVAAEDVRGRFGGSWNTYEGHGVSPARGEAYTVDHWGAGGRGVPLPEHVGDAMAAWILGQNEVRPVLVLIWWGWWWRPGVGWKIYPGWKGPHRGADGHIHVGYA